MLKMTERQALESYYRQTGRSALSAIEEPARARPEARDCIYRLFRNRRRPKLFCATPQDRPVPDFLGSGQWWFEGRLHPSDAAPPGFRVHAAVAGVQLNGFYLFQATGLKRAH